VRHTDLDFLLRAVEFRGKMGIHNMKTRRLGANITVTAAPDPKLSLRDSDGSGTYLSDCQIANAPAYTTDKAEAEKLWQISEGLVALRFAW
jgi:hypothetical protein